jgi:hypothetical protein
MFIVADNEPSEVHMQVQITINFDDLAAAEREISKVKKMLRLYRQADTLPLIQDIPDVEEAEAKNQADKAAEAILVLGKGARLVFRSICENIVQHGRATLEDVSATNQLPLDTVRAYHRNGMRSVLHKNAALPYAGEWSPTERRVVYTPKDLAECREFAAALD